MYSKFPFKFSILPLKKCKNYIFGWTLPSKWEFASNVVRFYAEYVSLENESNITHVLISEGCMGRLKPTKVS